MGIERCVSEKEKYAYMAGLFDGEGCFLLFKHTSKQCRSGYSWQIAATIAQNNIPFLEKIKAELGAGQIVKAKRGTSFISFSSNPLRELIPNILPYLKIKGPQAQLILDALGLMKTTLRTTEVNKKLEEINEKLVFLKKNYGVSDDI